jgi:ubiquinone biosynthesis protein
MPTPNRQPTSSLQARQREIVKTLSRHGLGFLVDRVHPSETLPTRPEHVRLALEELGPTFVKLGQTLSTRSDLLPPEYVAELAKLQDAAPPIAPDVARSVVIDELERELSEVFATFDDEPLAAASIGQAHTATLLDGSEVVVKVRRPGVVEQVEQDLVILQNLAGRAERLSERAVEIDAVGLAEEFGQTLRAELDYLTEGRNADRFADNFAGDEGVHIPRVHWETTTSRVLTMDRVRGIRAGDLDALDAAGIDRHELARSATRISAKMIFEDGLFHGDPHPGNFFVEEGGRIGLVDFGMVGTLSDRTRDQLGALLVAFTAHDADRVTDAVLALGVARHRVDRAELRSDIESFLGRYEGVGLGEISITEVLEEATAMMRRHRLHLPRDLALLAKVLVVEEGLGAALVPDYRLDVELAPYARQLMARERERAPEEWLRQALASSSDAAQLSTELPRQFRRLLREGEAGDFRIRVANEDLQALGARVERASTRIAVALLVAAMMEAGATLLAAERRRPRRRRTPPG